MITVKDVWRAALPGGTELLAGGAGLDRRVDWATALRTRPPAFDAVKGGEMAFVPVHSIRLLDERLDLSAVVESFAEKGGVAVAIVGDASAESVVLADRLLIPLLRLPDGVHVADVQQNTVRYILEQRTLLHERQQELQTSFMELALAGAGPPAIVDRLGAATSCTAVWLDADGAVRHRATPVRKASDAGNGPAPDAHGVETPAAGDEVPLPALSEVRRWAETVPAVAADPPVREFRAGAADAAALVSPIPLRDGIGGYVVVVGTGSELDQVARLAVARAASACAIELDRERAVLAARDELEGDFLESLLAGTYSSESAVLHRAERLGVDLSGECLVLCARPDGDGLARSRRDALTVGGQGWVRRRAPSALVTVRQGVLVAVLPAVSPADDVRRLASDLRLECEGALGGAPASVGIGRPKAGIPGVRASYREADQAVTMGTRLFGGSQVVAFADLGLHRLLSAMQSSPELRDFYDDQVRALVDYDRRTGAGLMKTLEAFFRCHGSPTEMAALLHLHRNTVLYRLRRIEEVGKVNLADPDVRLNLHLCLRVREVLQAAG